MRTSTLLIPLAASLMLGTAAVAQDQNQPVNPAPANDQMNQQPNDEQMQQHTMPQGSVENSGAQSMPQGGAMQNTAATSGMNPAQSTNGGMPIDQETSVNGIQAACTGVGDQQENNARWSQYPVKVVVSGTGHQFFAGETVSIAKSDGSQVAQMTCNAPWVLMKLEPGAYHATVDLPGHGAKTVGFTAPASGQREVNVVYAGQQEASDQTSAPRDEHRATDTSFTQPQAKPMDNSTVGNGAVDQPPMNEQDMKNGTMDQSPNNSDQSPQPK
ncbi:MAG: hypothetical protein ACTHPD_00410 [Rhizomicrobium sp.]